MLKLRIDRSKYIIFSLVLFSLTLLNSAVHQKVVAATKSGGITISPAYQDLPVVGNQSVSDVFSITNNDDTPATFELTTVDMGSLNESGGVAFSGLSADYASKYGLAKWLSLPEQTVTIAGHETRKINFNINPDDNFSPGGHYGAIVAKLVMDIKPSKNQFRLNPQAATILLVHKIGGETYDLLATVDKLNLRLGLPIYNLNLNFKNNGNVHVVPRGLVILKNPFGHEVGRGVINSESAYTLPDVNRNYSVSIQYSTRLLWPGKYSVSIAYRFDGTDEVQLISSQFYYFNLPLLIAVIAVLYLFYKFINRYGALIYGLNKRGLKFIGRHFAKTRVYKYVSKWLIKNVVSTKAYEYIAHNLRPVKKLLRSRLKKQLKVIKAIKSKKSAETETKNSIRVLSSRNLDRERLITVPKSKTKKVNNKTKH